LYSSQDSRDRSSDRSRRSHRDRSPSRDRHRRRDRDDKEKDSVTEKEKDRKSKDKDKEGDKEKEKDSEKPRDKEKDRERDRERDRDRDRDSRYRSERDRDRGSTRDRERERERERDRDRGRDSRRRRSSSRSPPRRRRSPDSRRRSRSPSYDDRRTKSRRRSEDRDASSKKDEEDAGPKQITLRDVISANPGISVPEAVMRLNAYNTAVARGLTPDPITVPSQQAAAIAAVASSGGLNSLLGAPLNPAVLGNLGVIGEGGATTKPHRELYVGNLPPGITVPQLAEFVNTAFKQLGLAKDPAQNTVVTAWVSPDGHFAFVELRTVEETTAALTYLNGIQVGAFNLRIGRPKGYNGSAAVSSVAVPMQGVAASIPGGYNPLLSAMSSLGGLGVGLGAGNPLMQGLNSSLGVGAGADALSHTIMVTNLPALISTDQIRELFTPFGELKAFNVIKASSGATQSAVFEYVNQALTDGVVGGMNNLDIADHRLSVQRIPASSAAVLLQPTAASIAAAATPAPAPVPTSAPVVLPAAQEGPDELESHPPSSVIRMSNMTTAEDLADDDMYDELTEDVAGECNTHGVVKSIVIPRGPVSGAHDVSVGKIFVHFTDVASAARSKQAVTGRRFNGRVVEAYFYPEELFLKKVYNLPANYLSERANGHSSGSSNGHNGHVATEDINDIDEGPSAGAATYDPADLQEDLD